MPTILREQPSSAQKKLFGSESDSEPWQDSSFRRSHGGPSRTHQKLADHETMSGERQCAEDHGPSLDRHVVAAFFPERQTKRCESHGRSCTEYAGEDFRSA